LNAADRLRSAGVEEAWKPVSEWNLFVEYMPPAVPAAAGVSGTPIEIPDAPDEETLITGRKKAEEDDDVDMIPLIDISMVLLVFFIMVSAAGALSPVDVPDMRFAGELATDPQAITISIEKANAEDVHYAVRSGPNPAKPDSANLPTPEAAF